MLIMFKVVNVWAATDTMASSLCQNCAEQFLFTENEAGQGLQSSIASCLQCLHSNGMLSGSQAQPRKRAGTYNSGKNCTE